VDIKSRPFSKTNLSAGVHTITATVTDNDGASDSKQVTITVNEFIPENQPPTVSITLPSTGSSFDEGDSVSFWGSASDPEQGTMSSQIQWTSSRDGSLGTGTFFSKTNLSAGVHTIIVSYSCSYGVDSS